MRDERSASERDPHKDEARENSKQTGKHSDNALDGKGVDKTADRQHPKYPQDGGSISKPAIPARPDKLAARDITPALKGWDYESGTINVRKVAGLDGLPKLQMRLDLGLLQMELTGRPDGARPHGCDSLLEYFESLLAEHRKRNDTELGFHLTAEQCQALRDEAAMYYHRYLSLFVLGEFPGVVRDTARNLRVLDLCGRYAVDEQDQLVLEQYRPYILMMNARAEASILFKEKQYARALKSIDAGLKQIRAFFARFGQGEVFAQSNEVKVLRKFAREIRRKLPVDPVRRLEGKLTRAIRDERYEDAARFRDEIAMIKRDVRP